MSKYLKKFETTAQYNAAKSGLILPNVSLVTENNKVEYNPISPVPPTPSHDYVEIGGIKWATMNVGTTSITDGGLYFQWGDTQGYSADQIGCEDGKKCFLYWGDYKYSEGGAASDYGTMTKYNDEDNLTTLQPSDDAVTAAWGGNWRMPTKEEFQTLITATTSAWTYDYEGSGVAGVVRTDKTDSSKVLFFPACGCAYDGKVSDGDAAVWSSSLEYIGGAYVFSQGDIGTNDRWYGYPVRGVLAEN